jgi:hypothetical protein
MTDERIDRLEREFDALKKMLIPDQAAIRREMDGLRRSLETDLEVSKQAIDARLAELAARRRATGGDDIGNLLLEITAVVSEAVMKAVMKRVGELIVASHEQLAQTLINSFTRSPELAGGNQ